MTSKPIDFWFHYVDNGYFENFTVTCPHCNISTPPQNISDEDTIACPKCGAKFKVKQKIWVEEIQSIAQERKQIE